MVLMIAGVLLGLLFLINPLRRNNFYMLHVGLVAAAAWYIESTYFPRVGLPEFIAKWRSVAMIFVVLHLISRTSVPFFAYGVDERGAQNGSWRIP